MELSLEVQYGQAAGKPLLLELARPKDRHAAPRPAVVFIHGGGWSGSDRTNGRPIILRLAEQGFVAVSIDYRLSGVAGFPAQLEDSKCAIRFLRAHAGDYGVDPKRIGVAGGSAGGHLAALVGLNEEKSFEGEGGWPEHSSKVSAVADLYGISDLAALMEQHKLPDAIVKLMRGTPREKPGLYRQASPLALVKTGAPPFYFAHGDKDTLVPISQSTQLAEALRGVGTRVDFHPMPGLGHGSIATLPEEIRAGIVAFFVDTLGPVSPAR